MKPAIDPLAWLMSHNPEHDHRCPAFVGLSLGLEALYNHGGDLRTALDEASDLRAEIAIAYLLSGNVPDHQTRIRLVEILKALDD